MNSRFVSFLKVMLLVLVPLAVVFAFRECSRLRRDNERLERNQDILLHNGKVEIGQTASGKSHASADALQLSVSELRKKPDSLLAVTQKELKIKDSRVVGAFRTSSSTQLDVKSPITTDSQDTSHSCGDPRKPVLEAPRHVQWSDPWVSLRGTIEGDSFSAHIESRDTLQVIVHRVPKRFLFFRFGTKAVRMEAVSQNPHTQLSYPRLIVVTK